MTESYFRALVEAMEDMVYVCGPDFRIQYMNPAMESYLGREAVGEHCYKAFFGADMPCPWCMHSQVVVGKRTVRYEIECPKDGRIYIATSTPVPQGEDQVLSLTILHDITDLRRTQEALEAKNRQLARSQRLESLGTLAGGIAHDFNNLLGSILGYAGLIKTHAGEDGEVQRYAGAVEKAAKRGAALVERLMAFSTEGHKEKGPVDLNQAVRSVLEILLQTVDRGIELSPELSEEPLYVFGNRADIEQAVMNLAINAVQAIEEATGPEVKGRVVFRTGVREGEATLTVEDTGPGIPKEMMDRLFDPFFTTKSPGRGSGLGLAVVYGIVKAHGGSIEIDSAPGEGARFTLVFPRMSEEELERAAGAEGPEEKARTAGGAPVDEPASGKTILVVDDEPLLRELLQEVLGRMGYKVYTAQDGASALELYRRHGREIDLVIIDMLMPGMNGLELFRALKSMNPDVAAIVASGYVEKGRISQAKKEGVLDFIAKPFSVSELTGKLSRHLERRP